MRIEVDKCPICGLPIIWDEEAGKDFYLCNCFEKDPSCVCDGCTEGMCLCNDNDNY